MPEDAEAAREERAFASVARYMLDFQEPDDSLRHRQSSRHGFRTPVATILGCKALAVRPLRCCKRNSPFLRRQERCAEQRILQLEAKRQQLVAKNSKSLR